jgi:hypothetical protein
MKLLPRLEEFSDYALYNIAGDDVATVKTVLDFLRHNGAAAEADEIAREEINNIANAREVVIAHIEHKGVEAFLRAMPNYHQSEKNAELLVGWCKARGVPTSLWNLSLAFRDLSEDGQLETAPPPAAPVVDKWASVTLCRGDALAEYQPGGDEQAVLAKVTDEFLPRQMGNPHPNQTDYARRAHDRQLALLAGQQRRGLSTLPAHYNQKVVI